MSMLVSCAHVALVHSWIVATKIIISFHLWTFQNYLVNLFCIASNIFHRFYLSRSVAALAMNAVSFHFIYLMKRLFFKLIETWAPQFFKHTHPIAYIRSLARLHSLPLCWFASTENVFIWELWLLWYVYVWCFVIFRSFLCQSGFISFVKLISHSSHQIFIVCAS